MNQRESFKKAEAEAKRVFMQQRLSDETWSQSEFRYSLERCDGNPQNAVLQMLRQSRRNLESAITPTPPEIQNLLIHLDEYFQAAFLAFFKIYAPISLAKVTLVTRQNTEHADRIRKMTFIDIQNHYLSTNKFVHFAIHEGLHLCISEFPEIMIEEAFIEFCIEEMFIAYPSRKFSYSPVSDVYQEWKNNLQALFILLPDLKKYFIRFALYGDPTALSVYLKKNLNHNVRNSLITQPHTRDTNYFLTQLDNMVESLIT